MGMIFSKELEANLKTLKEVATVAALSTISSPTNGLEALVLADENNSGKKSKYKYNGTAWVFVTLLEDLDHKLIFTDKQSIYLTNKNKQPIKMGDILPFVDYAALLAANPAIPNKLYMTMKGQLYYYNTTTLTYKLISGGGGSGGSSLLGTVATKAAIVPAYPNPDDYNSVIVTADEEHDGQTTWYLWLNNAWNYQGIYFPETLEISVSERNARVDVIAPNIDINIPIPYLVGKGHLSIYLEGELLLKDSDYTEVGTNTYKSTKVQFKFTVPKEARLVFIRNVASYSGDSMITRLTDEVFLKYFNSSLIGNIKISAIDTSITDLGNNKLSVADKRTPKGWVNFNGTGVVAIRDSYGVSSITDLATGSYKVNMGTPAKDLNYVVLLSTSDDDVASSFAYESGANNNRRTVNDFRIYTVGMVGVTSSAPADRSMVNVAIFGG